MKKENEDLEDEFTKYFSWVLASGLHGSGLIKPTLDFIKQTRTQAYNQGRENILEEYTAYLLKRGFVDSDIYIEADVVGEFLQALNK